MHRRPFLMPRLQWPLRVASAIGLLLVISQAPVAGCGRSASCDSLCDNYVDKCTSGDGDLARNQCLETCQSSVNAVSGDCSDERDAVLLCVAGASSVNCENPVSSAACTDEAQALDACQKGCWLDGEACSDDTDCCSGTCAGDGYCGSGGSACNDFLYGDPYSASWSTTAMDTDFQSQASFDAYDALNTCACVNTMDIGGCEDACTAGDNGTDTPNFCDSGSTPDQDSSGCYGCLMTNCGTELSDCAAN